MGIALPRWIVEAQNNIWVLGVYGLLFGVSLPMLVVCTLIATTMYASRTDLMIFLGSLVVWISSKDEGWHQCPNCLCFLQITH